MHSYFDMQELGRARALLRFFACATAIFVAIGIFAKVDIVARGVGQLSANGDTILMKAPRAGILKSINASNGKSVKKGKILASFDCDNQQQIIDTVEEQIKISREALNSQLIVADEVLKGKEKKELFEQYGKYADKNSFSNKNSASTKVAIAQRELEKATIARRQWTARENILLEKIKVAKSMAEHAEAQLARERSLKSQGFISDAALTAAQDNLIKAQGDQYAAIGELESLRADMNANTSSDVLSGFQAKDQIYEVVMKSAATISDLETQLAKSKADIQSCEVVAPIDGKMFWISETRQGEWRQLGDPLFKVVPEIREFEVEAQFKDGDIPFIKDGQKAIIKVDGLPYLKYGTLSGKISFVSPDAITSTEKGNLYKVTLLLDSSNTWAADHGVELKPGIGITVDVVTGERKLYEYFFEPIVEAVRTSFRER